MSVLWGIHRNRHSDAYSLMSGRWREPNIGVERVDLEKTFQAFETAKNYPC